MQAEEIKQHQDRLKEIRAYVLREETQLNELIELRQDTMKQLNDDNETLRNLQTEKTKVYNETQLKIKEVKDLEADLKKEKENFELGHKMREEQITKKEEILTKSYQDLFENKKKLDKAKESLIAVETSQKSKDKRLKDLEDELDIKRSNLHEKEKEIKKEEYKLQKKLDKIAVREELLEQDLREAALKIEASNKTVELYKVKEAELEKEKLHILSQQEALKVAYNEIKRKEDEYKHRP